MPMPFPLELNLKGEGVDLNGLAISGETIFADSLN